MDICNTLLNSYALSLDTAQRFAGYSVDRKTQLRNVQSCALLGRDAYSCASLLGKISDGIELLEQARGIVWRNSLHLRSPNLSSIPSAYRSELKGLLHDLSRSMVDGAIPLQDSALSLTISDMRHNKGMRLQRLIREIRQEPGCEYFMRGPRFEDLSTVAEKHHVVILVTVRAKNSAVVLCPGGSIDTLDLVGVETTQLMMELSLGARKGYRSNVPDNVEDLDRSIGIDQGKNSRIESHLKKLWLNIVKPVISHLHLQVLSVPHVVIAYSAFFCRRKMANLVPEFTGVQ
jgi:hypothetical protein